MKIAVTGHSAGIGKAIFELLSHEHEVIGFSLENGYDIGIESSRQQIIDSSLDADVFINNAYHMLGQIDLLRKITRAWNKQNKTIINLGSKRIHNSTYDSLTDKKYIAAKQKLQEVVESAENELPKICNVMPGLIDTDLVKHIPSTKLSSTQVANVIKYIIDNKDNIWIQEIVIDNPEIQ